MFRRQNKTQPHSRERIPGPARVVDKSDGDLKDRETAEKASDDREQWYRVLFERHSLPMVVVSAETLALLAVNEAAIRRYGYTREEFLALSLRDLWPPEEALNPLTGFPNLGLRDIALGGLRSWQHRTKTGSVIDVEVDGYNLQLSGRASYALVLKDVTLRKQSERMLRESESQLREIFESFGRWNCVNGF